MRKPMRAEMRAVANGAIEVVGIVSCYIMMRLLSAPFIKGETLKSSIG